MSEMLKFADDPAEFFGFDSASAHRMARGEAEAHQLHALRARFLAMRDTLPPLKAMADAQGISAIETIDDAALLLFPHSIYKSYPARLLDEYKFPQLTQWLSRLTLVDLSPLENRAFDSIDAWLEALDADTELEIRLSSGTSGQMSFMPRGKRESEVLCDIGRLNFPEWTDPVEADFGDRRFAVIFPTIGGGKSGIARSLALLKDVYAASPQDAFALIEHPQSVDVQYFMTLKHQAIKAGTHETLEPSAYVKNKMDEGRATLAGQADRLGRLLDLIAGPLQKQKIMLAGAPMFLLQLASEGLKRGIEKAFPAGSLVMTFGGTKGFDIAGDWQETVKRFAGVAALGNLYGMTELVSTLSLCRNHRYHCPPWIIPYVLDAQTGRLLPRNGVQTGRAAFFDLVAQTYWGGVVSADNIEIDWRGCSCGRTTPHMSEPTRTVSKNIQEEHEFGCADPAAVLGAMATLNEGMM